TASLLSVAARKDVPRRCEEPYQITAPSVVSVWSCRSKGEMVRRLDVAAREGALFSNAITRCLNAGARRIARLRTRRIGVPRPAHRCQAGVAAGRDRNAG